MQTRALLARIFRNWPAKVLSFAAALLLLVIHDITRLEERFITVPLGVQLNGQLVPSAPYPDQVRIRLRGESDAVFAITAAELIAFLDLRDYDSPGEYRVAIEVERATRSDGSIALEITTEPDTVIVALEEKLLRTVPVTPATTAFPGPGFELTQVISTPSQVEVEGPRSRVEAIDTVRTEELDLSSRREDFTERMRLQRPDELVRFPGGDTVELRVLIQEAVALQTFDPIEFVVTGLPDGLQVAEAPAPGLVRVQAPQLGLDGVTPGDISLIVDASSISAPGTWRLPAQPIVPPGFVVLRYEPTSIQLVVEPQQ